MIPLIFNRVTILDASVSQLFVDPFTDTAADVIAFSPLTGTKWCITLLKIRMPEALFFANQDISMSTHVPIQTRSAVQKAQR